MQYLYPHEKFPYDELKFENGVRDRLQAEYELADTGVLDDNRYFEVDIEYAKASEEDVIGSYRVTNKGAEEAEITVLPQITLRNTWSHNKNHDEDHERPSLSENGDGGVEVRGLEKVYSFVSPGAEGYLFTDNETNSRWLHGNPNGPKYTKEAFHRYFIQRDKAAVNPKQEGTKVCAIHHLTLAPGESKTVKFRLAAHDNIYDFSYLDHILEVRKEEADDYYAVLQEPVPAEEEKVIQRQALGGMLWSKQFYYYDVEEWLDGDDCCPEPAQTRLMGRNNDWRHLKNHDIISMPDKWEYPWYAAWDLAFHCIPLAMVDADFAKRQLVLMLKERYQHPNGQIPAYEWHFSDVNPPVHAWACYRVFQMDRKRNGEADYFFLERCFHKLLINFTWWVNRKDKNGNNVFQGGFLGLDNIGLFDRSAPLPGGGHIDQADGTAWMAFYSLSMMKIALELAQQNPVYEHTATKFLEHFLHIAEAINSTGENGKGLGLWDEADGFYYDILHQNGKDPVRLKVKSMVGVIPLFAVEIIEDDILEKLPHFRKRLKWLFENRPDFTRAVSYQEKDGEKKRMLSLVSQERLERILSRVFDEKAFLSDYGIRSLSKEHLEEPYQWHSGKIAGEVKYNPGESDSSMFGGNSNWRGPVWFPLNYLLYESLQKHHYYYRDELNLGDEKNSSLYFQTRDLSNRLIDIFRRYPQNAKGLGASHQTGWTGLVAKLIQAQSEKSIVH